MEVSTDIHRKAKELGLEALANMDPLCESHLRKLEFHPVDAEFSGTGIYNEFHQLVVDHAENCGFDWTEIDATLKSELEFEVRDAFDEGYYNPSQQVECVGCLDDGDISIRVHNSDSVSADSILNGKSRSGHTGQDDGMNEWR